MPSFFPESFTYLTVDMRDSVDEDLGKFIPMCCEFILQCKDSKGRCFVHCNAGRSRSASIVLAFCMLHAGMPSYEEAFSYVSSKRSIHPNISFQLHLRQLSAELIQQWFHSFSDLKEASYFSCFFTFSWNKVVILTCELIFLYFNGYFSIFFTTFVSDNTSLYSETILTSQ